ncbi:hypothetical protein D3C81_1170530 [compost metagenome]
MKKKSAELVTDVVYIEGACVSTLTLSEFSREAIMEHSNLTEDELAEITHERNAGGGDDATDFTVQHMIDRTIVTVFSSGGEAYFYIGPNTKWLG